MILWSQLEDLAYKLEIYPGGGGGRPFVGRIRTGPERGSTESYRRILKGFQVEGQLLNLIKSNYKVTNPPLTSIVAPVI